MGILALNPPYDNERSSDRVVKSMSGGVQDRLSETKPIIGSPKSGNRFSGKIMLKT